MLTSVLTTARTGPLCLCCVVSYIGAVGVFVNLILVGLLKIVFVRQVFLVVFFIAPRHGRQACNANVEAQARRALEKIEAHLGRACAMLCNLANFCPVTLICHFLPRIFRSLPRDFSILPRFLPRSLIAAPTRSSKPATFCRLAPRVCTCHALQTGPCPSHRPGLFLQRQQSVDGILQPALSCRLLQRRDLLVAGSAVVHLHLHQVATVGGSAQHVVRHCDEDAGAEGRSKVEVIQGVYAWHYDG